MKHAELVEALALKLLDHPAVQPERSPRADRLEVAAEAVVTAYAKAHQAVEAALKKLRPDVPGGTPPTCGVL